MNSYKQATCVEKRVILDEFCAVCNYNRKYAIRILHKKPTTKIKKRGPRSIYQNEKLIQSLKQFWLFSEQPFSRKLKAIIPLWLPSYEASFGALLPDIKVKLLAISAATIDKVLKPVRANHKIKRRCTTKLGSLLKSHIPIQFSHWDIKKPGYLLADTAAHCGDSVAGQFAWSITATDICTGWRENRAVWNKDSGLIYNEISDIEANLPFKVLGFDSDNRTEFMNHALYDYFTNRTIPVLFTRLRPYKKNDNAQVEQKNSAHVRNLLGYDRLDDKLVVAMMNDLYRKEWSLFQNHFMPSMKLLTKERVGAKFTKKYEAPKTPYERVIASAYVDDASKSKITTVHLKLNPFTLKKAIESKLNSIFEHVKVTSNVRHRL